MGREAFSEGRTWSLGQQLHLIAAVKHQLTRRSGSPRAILPVPLLTPRVSLCRCTIDKDCTFLHTVLGVS